MNRSDITELHYIALIANVPSIVERGILSNARAADVPHQSLAMAEVQERRRPKQIPGGRRLHEYVNLYFDAHNPMLSSRRSRNDEICILRIEPAVLDAPGVIVADCNASSKWARFLPVPAGLQAIDRERVFATFWLHSDDPYDEIRHKSEKCAEVLVPDRVQPKLVIGAYVANQTALSMCQALNVQLPVRIKRDIFFWRAQ